MAKWMHRLGLAWVLLLMCATVGAKEAALVAADPVLEKRMMAIAQELRCLVCQNQTIADSSAGLAIDLRNQVREMLQSGKSEQDIMDYMTARYGEFVLYRPPVKNTTVLLWFGPLVLLISGAGILFWTLRRRSKLPPEAFEPDEAMGEPLSAQFPSGDGKTT